MNMELDWENDPELRALGDMMDNATSWNVMVPEDPGKNFMGVIETILRSLSPERFDSLIIIHTTPLKLMFEGRERMISGIEVTLFDSSYMVSVTLADEDDREDSYSRDVKLKDALGIIKSIAVDRIVPDIRLWTRMTDFEFND